MPNRDAINEFMNAEIATVRKKFIKKNPSEKEN